MERKITFKGKRYPIRYIRINGKDLRIGTTSLWNAIRPVNEIVTLDSEDLDSTFFVYVEDNEISLPEEQFKQAVLNVCLLEENEI